MSGIDGGSASLVTLIEGSNRIPITARALYALQKMLDPSGRARLCGFFLPIGRITPEREILLK